jgi:hypothetical protein
LAREAESAKWKAYESQAGDYEAWKARQQD